MVTRYLARKAAPTVPAAMPLGKALNSHAGLAQLKLMAKEAQSRLVTVQSMVPSAMRGSLIAGVVDDEGWTLLASSASTAAKLRQLRPQLEAELLAKHGPGVLRIKIASR